jgi:arsenate reductase-like glutaredoxin family protein
LLDLLAKIPNLLRKPLLVDGKRALQGVDDSAKLKAFLEGKS